MLKATRWCTLVFMAAFVACSGSTGTSGGQGGSTIETVVVPTSLPSEFSRYVFGDPEKISEKVALSKQKTEECMHSRGWTGYVGNATIVGDRDPHYDIQSYGEQFAYGITTRLAEDAAVPKDPNDAYFASLTSEQLSRLNDDLWAAKDSVRPGCMFVGALSGFGNLRFVSKDADVAQSEISSVVETDPDYQAVTLAWSTCMKARGYSFLTPDEVVHQINGKLQDLSKRLGHYPKPTDAGVHDLNVLEFQLFWADMKCRADTNYSRITSEITNNVERHYIETHPGLLDG